MLRNRFTIPFLLLANILVLFNTIVPHHHHEKIVCVEEKHCEGENASNDKHSENEHHHDNSSEHEFCVLKPDFVLPSNNIKIETSSIILDLKNVYSNLSISFLIFSYFDSQIKQPLILLNFKVSLANLYSIFFISSKGFRGPPEI